MLCISLHGLPWPVQADAFGGPAKVGHEREDSALRASISLHGLPWPVQADAFTVSNETGIGKTHTG